MMKDYATASGGMVDGIYDRNVRKWLGMRARSVNRGIRQTLEEEPERFVAYNNGITLVCRRFTIEDQALLLEEPYVVNGCQTTRTLYDFMETHFPALGKQLLKHEAAEPYRRALLPLKVIVVPGMEPEYLNKITCYSNKQNAIRGRDFLSLEQVFQQFKQELQDTGYFLETQAGEYYVLSKVEKDRFPKQTNVINVFDALRFYAAAVFEMPHIAFGHSGELTPGGRYFENIIEALAKEDLWVPWLMAQEADALGYTVGAKRVATVADEHRSQTRYLFLFLIFRLVRDVFFAHEAVRNCRNEIYNILLTLKRDRDNKLGEERSAAAFSRLLFCTDQCVATYMRLAETQRRYTDRNAFLKTQDLVSEIHLTQAITGPMLSLSGLPDQYERLT